MLVDQNISEAIRTKRILGLSYGGKERTCEPHAVYYDADGDLTLLAWQLTGTGQGWRAFHVVKISGTYLPGGEFTEARKGYTGKRPFEYLFKLEDGEQPQNQVMS